MRKIYLSLVFLGVFTHCDNNRSRVIQPPAGGLAPYQNTNGLNESRLMWAGEIDIDNADKYRDFLRAFGVCGQYTINFGASRCKSWDNGAGLRLTFEKEKLPAKVKAVILPRLDNTAGWLFNSSLQTGLHLSLDTEADYIEDYEGFQARFSPPTGISPLIIKAEDSDPEVSRMIEVTLYYGGRTTNSLKIGRADLENKAKSSSKNNRTTTTQTR